MAALAKIHPQDGGGEVIRNRSFSKS